MTAALQLVHALHHGLAEERAGIALKGHHELYVQAAAEELLRSRQHKSRIFVGVRFHRIHNFDKSSLPGGSDHIGAVIQGDDMQVAFVLLIDHGVNFFEERDFFGCVCVTSS